MKKQALLYVNLAVVLFGLAGLFAKWIGLPALYITFGRVFFSSLTLGIWLLVKKQSIRTKNGRDRALLILSGAVLALHWWSFLYSIQLSTVAVGTITFASFPMFVILLEAVIRRKRPSAWEISAAVLILAGVLITVPEFSFENSLVPGILTGMVSSAAYAVLTLMNRHFSDKYSASVIAFYEQASAAVLLVPFLFSGPVISGFSGKDAALTVLLGVFMTAAAHTLFINGLKGVSAGLAGIISSLESVYAILFALIFLKEVPSLREAAGAVIILGTVILVQIIRDRKES